MEFHPNKCEILSITRKKSPVENPYQIHGQQLKHSIVPSIWELGLQTICVGQNTLTWFLVSPTAN